MISLRFLPRAHWEPRLRYYRSKPLDGLGPLNTAEWWTTEWGFLFTVPVEEAGCCHEEAFRRLVSDIIRTAPNGTTFPGPNYQEPDPEPDDEEVP